MCYLFRVLLGINVNVKCKIKFKNANYAISKHLVKYIIRISLEKELCLFEICLTSLLKQGTSTYCIGSQHLNTAYNILHYF